METLLLLLSIANILKESFKIFTKNGKIFALIALFTLFINSIQYLSSFYSIKPLITDLVIKQNLLQNTASNNNPQESNKILTEISKDLKILIGLELIYFTIDIFVSLLTTTATILAAALVYGGNGNDLSFNTLLTRTAKSYLRPLVTGLLILLFGLVFIFVFVFVLSIISLILTNPIHLLLAAIPLAFSAIIVFIYWSVNWNLAIVISAVEKLKGFEAIGKAGEIIKGMKLKGFLVHLLVTVIGVVLSYGIQLMAARAKSESVAMLSGLAVVCLSSLVNMYHFAVFTVIYYMCKKNHGERVELEEASSNGYSIVATTVAPLVDHQLP